MAVGVGEGAVRGGTSHRLLSWPCRPNPCSLLQGHVPGVMGSVGGRGPGSVQVLPEHRGGVMATPLPAGGGSSRAALPSVHAPGGSLSVHAPGGSPSAGSVSPPFLASAERSEGQPAQVTHQLPGVAGGPT